MLLLMLGCTGQNTTAQSIDTDVHNALPASSAVDPTSDSQKAVQALDDMLALAQAGDWTTYIDRYYGEAHKFQSPADREQLIQRFQAEWGERVIVALEQATQITPEIEENRAIFKIDGEPIFMLYRTDDGRWTFHL